MQQGLVFFKQVLALVARGMFSLLVKWLALRAGQRQGGVFRLPPPYLWTPLSPQRVKGCSPLTIPMRKSKPKNASRFAKTGCGAQRPLRALSGTRVLLTAAPTAPPCIRRRRRSSLLHFFSFLRFAASQLVLPLCFWPSGATTAKMPRIKNRKTKEPISCQC